VSDLPEAFSHPVTEKWTRCAEGNNEARINFGYEKPTRNPFMGILSY
jgi:hypothetical protein